MREIELMRKIAIIGAGGQVGAEVTLLMSNQTDHFLVPICRNHSSSAFLRYRGIPCRHGLITEPEIACGLIGDCDIIVNFALSKSLPHKAKTINSQIIENSIKYSPKEAKIIYFSTTSVYGEPRPERFFNRPNAYGREKLRGERLAIRTGRLYGKQVFVLRLGHVCGELQNITDLIREIIKAGPVHMPNAGKNLSNTVYTATIAEAIINIASGLEQPGIYDLVCMPQWTWRDVYEYEADCIMQNLQVEDIGAPKKKQARTFVKSLLGQFLGVIVNNQFIKETASKVLARMPENLNMRVKAVYSKARVKNEVSGLFSHQMSHSALSWYPVGDKFLVSLSKTRDLLNNKTLFKLPEQSTSKAFPSDIPLYRN
jgi:nucleoside-diphosphate-sugar epimerase